MTSTPADESLFLRLYLDHHIIGRLPVDLRKRGYDVLTTEDAGLEKAPDEEQLEFAAGEGRAILTFNIRDFAPLHASWISSGRTHSGIIVSRQMGVRQYGEFLRRMLRLLNHASADDLANTLIHLERFKQAPGPDPPPR